MKQLQKKDIERVADKTLLEANVNAPAVMADEIAEFVCDLNFEWRDLNECSPDGKVLATAEWAREPEGNRKPGKVVILSRHDDFETGYRAVCEGYEIAKRKGYI